MLAEESFVKNRVHCSFATTDKSATVGYIAADKSKPMILLHGNRVDSLKCAAVNLVFRRPFGGLKFDEIIFGDENMIAKLVVLDFY